MAFSQIACEASSGNIPFFQTQSGFPYFCCSSAPSSGDAISYCQPIGQNHSAQNRFRALLLLSILVIDLPIMASYNYPTRFFLPLMPFFAILSALFISDIYALADLTIGNQKSKIVNSTYPKLIGAGLSLILVFSLARLISVMLLFMNDARIPAGKFLASFPTGTSLEHTEYPPTIPAGHFDREHNYPIHFQNTPDEPIPTNKNYLYNIGEVGTG